MNASMVATETNGDPVLNNVLHFTQHNWPEKPEPVFRPYYNKRLDLTQGQDPSMEFFSGHTEAAVLPFAKRPAYTGQSNAQS